MVSKGYLDDRLHERDGQLQDGLREEVRRRAVRARRILAHEHGALEGKGEHDGPRRGRRPCRPS